MHGETLKFVKYDMGFVIPRQTNAGLRWAVENETCLIGNKQDG